jgi:hypothetical protein
MCDGDSNLLMLVSEGCGYGNTSVKALLQEGGFIRLFAFVEMKWSAVTCLRPPDFGNNLDNTFWRSECDASGNDSPGSPKPHFGTSQQRSPLSKTQGKGKPSHSVSECAVLLSELGTRGKGMRNSAVLLSEMNFSA